MPAACIALSNQKALSEGVTIDREAGVIRNVSIIAKGPATGHGFFVDGVMLQQVVDGINADVHGVRCRLTHPNGDMWFDGADGIEVLAGSCKNARLESDRVRGDVHFGKYAKRAPRGGNIRDYLLDVAEEHPQFVGLSIVFDPDEFVPQFDDDGRELDEPAGRVKEVLAVDFVGDPGANPTGLLSDSGGADPPPPKKGGRTMAKTARKRKQARNLQEDGGEDVTAPTDPNEPVSPTNRQVVSRKFWPWISSETPAQTPRVC